MKVIIAAGLALGMVGSALAAEDLDEAFKICRPHLLIGSDGTLFDVAKGWEDCRQVYLLWKADADAKNGADLEKKDRLKAILQGK